MMEWKHPKRIYNHQHFKIREIFRYMVHTKLAPLLLKPINDLKS